MKRYAYQIDYRAAIEWCNNKYIQPFAEMYEIDPQIWEDGERRGAWEENPVDNEIFQILLSDCSDDDVKFLTDHFPDLLFIHGVKIDNWFLCVDHFGTAWDYVYISMKPDEDGLMLPSKWDEKGRGARDWEIDKHAYFHRYELKEKK